MILETQVVVGGSLLKVWVEEDEFFILTDKRLMRTNMETRDKLIELIGAKLIAENVDDVNYLLTRFWIRVYTLDDKTLVDVRITPKAENQKLGWSE